MILLLFGGKWESLELNRLFKNMVKKNRILIKETNIIYSSVNYEELVSRKSGDTDHDEINDIRY